MSYFTVMIVAIQQNDHENTAEIMIFSSTNGITIIIKAIQKPTNEMVFSLCHYRKFRLHTLFEMEKWMNWLELALHNEALILNRNERLKFGRLCCECEGKKMKEREEKVFVMILIVVLRIGFRVLFEIIVCPNGISNRIRKRCNFREKSMASLKLKLHVPSHKCHSNCFDDDYRIISASGIVSKYWQLKISKHKTCHFYHFFCVCKMHFKKMTNILLWSIATNIPINN